MGQATLGPYNVWRFPITGERLMELYRRQAEVFEIVELSPLKGGGSPSATQSPNRRARDVSSSYAAASADGGPNMRDTGDSGGEASRGAGWIGDPKTD